MISNYDLRQFSQVSRLLIIVRGNTHPVHVYVRTSWMYSYSRVEYMIHATKYLYSLGIHLARAFILDAHNAAASESHPPPPLITMARKSKATRPTRRKESKIPAAKDKPAAKAKKPAKKPAKKVGATKRAPVGRTVVTVEACKQ